ncbi:hypothetical protein N7467_000851 [Penicillium canescens]|nr:hypothetical protein N7467_000851 [Penicillium canescens]
MQVRSCPDMHGDIPRRYPAAPPDHRGAGDVDLRTDCKQCLDECSLKLGGAVVHCERCSAQAARIS